MARRSDDCLRWPLGLNHPSQHQRQEFPMSIARILLLLGLVLGLTGPAAAESARIGDIHIDAAWARASIGAAKAGAAYLTLVNHGSEADRLIAVETKVAKRSALHTHKMEEGVMKMRPVEAIEIDPGSPTLLAPGGLHIMLMGLEAPLEKGKHFPLKLVFERAGAVDVMVEVLEPTAMEPAPHMHQHDPSHEDGEHKHQDHSS